MLKYLVTVNGKRKSFDVFFGQTNQNGLLQNGYFEIVVGYWWYQHSIQGTSLFELIF